MPDSWGQGTGEISGLSVKEEQAGKGITISPGVALDRYGRVLNICEQPVISSETRLPGVDAGAQYKYQIRNSGTPPFTYAIVRGELPAHLVLDPKTGIISGVLPKKIKSVGIRNDKRMFEEDDKESAFTVRVMDSCPTGRLSSEKDFTISAPHLRQIRPGK
ncbi:MAG: hypothetical protein EPN25_13030 [Nitrospirae bacterium]|nr:MAG: hypothetical protein EPN25_13030 [Nitrospirota bacterium]